MSLEFYPIELSRQTGAVADLIPEDANSCPTRNSKFFVVLKCQINIPNAFRVLLRMILK